jgi:glycosyltransferase involved in cell wall biosynthesis
MFKVSVIVASYNHSDIICRAIDSILAQQANFKIQVNVIDDGSQDNTQELLRTQYEHDNRVFFIFSEHKKLMNTYNLGFRYCQGKYIAFCDADDYWYDNQKLQKQVDYMDQNSDCGLCVTRVYTEKRQGELIPMSANIETINKNLTFDNLLRGNSYINAQSIMIRRSDFYKYIDFEKFIRLKFQVWDLPICLTLIQHVKFHCLDFYSAVFVKKVESVTQTKKRIRRLKYILGQYWTRAYFICKYGCRIDTFLYLVYKFIRDIASVILKRWNNE